MRDLPPVWLKLSGCSLAITIVVVFYLLTPVPEALGFGMWRTIGMLLIGVTGAVAGLVSRLWTRAALSVLAGLVSGAIFAEVLVPSHSPLAWMGSELASGLIAGCLGAAGTTVFSSRSVRKPRQE